MAQNPDVEQSEEFSLKDYNDITPKPAGYNLNSFFTYTVYKNQIHLQEFSKVRLTLTKELIVDLPGDEKSERTVLKLISSHINACNYFISSEIDKKLGLYKVYGFSINYLGKSTLPVLLEKMSLKYWKQDWTYGFTVSPNEKYFVIYHDFSINPEVENLLEFKIYDLPATDMKRESSIRLPASLENYKLMNIMIDDSARFFLTIIRRSVTVGETDYKLFTYFEEDGESLEEIKIFRHLFPFNVSFVMDKTNTIFCLGLMLDENNLTQIKGYFCIRVSNVNPVVISKSAIPIDEEFNTAYFGGQEGHTYRVICNLPLLSAVMRTDSSWIFSSEVMYSGYETGENLGRTVYFYGDILTAIVSKEGRLLNIKICTKNQLGNEADHNLGCLVAQSAAGVSYIYLDNPKNYKNDKRVKNWGMEKKGFAVVVSASVDTNVSVKYKIIEELGGLHPTNLRIKAGACISDNNKEYVFFYMSLKDFTIIKLRYL